MLHKGVLACFFFWI